MRFSISCIVIFFVPFYAISQVGIGTTAPNAQLEIKSTNQATPSNTDGILIPKVDEFPATPPTASQDGMMVYVTGSGTPSKGYYYWDNATMSWVVFSSSVGKINDLSDGKSDNDGTNDGSSVFLGINAGANDDSTDNQNVGIGFEALQTNTTGNKNYAFGYKALSSNTIGNNNLANGSWSLSSNTIGSQNTATGNSSLISNTTGANNSTNGYRSLQSNTTGDGNTAFGSTALSSNSVSDFNTAIGFNSGYTSIGDRNIFLGYSAGYFETGNDKLYIESSNADADNALIYGEFDNNILRVNGELQLGNTAATRYAMPTADGSTNQVLQTDGAGSLTWVDGSTLGVEKINDLSDGKSDNDGTQNGSSIFLGINAGLNDNGTDNQNVGIGYQALPSNTTGSQNTATGYQALFSNTFGTTNTSNGSFSLFSNTTGYQNTATGYQALFSNTTGYQNSSNGVESLYSNTIGSSNAANGYRSLYSNTIGTSNAANGYRTLYSNTTGICNTANGYQPLYSNTTGSNNTANGSFSLLYNTTGSNNTANGYRSGHDSLGDRNIFLGYESGYYETGSDKLYIESSNADANNALIYGEFDTNILRINGELQLGNTAATRYAMPTADGTTNQVLQTDGAGNLSWVDASTLTKNTLDQAYDEGGAGAGRIITATDGAVTIAGEDGFLVTGTLGSGDVAPSGAGTKMFFNPRKAAFRAGIVNGAQWDDASIGNYSFAIGVNTTASGNASTAIGWNTTASGDYSTAMGFGTTASGSNSTAMGNNPTASGYNSTAMGASTTASGSSSTAIGFVTTSPSAYETAIGSYNTNYTPANTTSWDATDRLFVIGNGTGNANRSNALTIYKNGLMNINEEYNMPLTDGTTNQVMKTDGSGDLSWVNASSLINGLLRADGNTWPTTGAGVEIAYANGIGLGYIQSYDRDTSNWKNLEISANEINLKTNNASRVTVQNDGKVKILVASDASGTAGTGSLEIANSLRIDDNEIITNQNTILLLQNDNNGDLAVDGLTLYVDSSANRIGFQNLTPSTDLHLKQSDNLQAGGGGFTFESALANLNWKIYHSGSALSFAENGVRRAYISAATGAYVTTSDRTLKKNITRVEDDVLSKFSEIEVYRYHYLDQNPSDEKTLGVMAQEIQLQFPELVTTDEDGKLGMNYGGLSVVAIKAIKEQQIEIENQRKEIEELKKLVQQLLDKK